MRARWNVHTALGALTLVSALGGWWAFHHLTSHYHRGAYVSVTVPTTAPVAPTTAVIAPATTTERVSVPASSLDVTGIVGAWGSMVGGVAGAGGLVVSVRRRPPPHA